MKSLISAFAFAAVMGIAALASPASAQTGNTCAVVNDGYRDFGEMQCTRVFPFWYTPVAYKNHGGGNYQYNTGSPDKPDHHYCPPKWDKPKWDYPKWDYKPIYDIR